ncbi:C4-dicarboxylate transport protein [Mesorhizobium escarrei]|uniref:C4-dicarboxylate transport protein n=1 Tax=Mesorhizobium escarrei TaxID=666018 RepID=A0ABM9DPV2_9HYPH|nr:cation:dicarboxylase symporter family transporter [Mesorhizobium escarrei]CAH2398178.1 C4-dicarboxylate transport protein [Mesorhizobium escarrei]
MLAPQVHSANAGPRKPHIARLYVQVLAAVALGVAVGYFCPGPGEALKPLGDAFIKLVKIIIAPVIFLTIATGIGGMNDLKKVGRVAGKAMIYFLTFSSLALIVGLIVANVVQPGAGLNIDPAALDVQAVKGYAAKVHEQSVTGFLMNIIPITIVGAFAEGDILQVLFFSVLFGIALAMVGDTGKPVLSLLQALLAPVFKLVGILMRAAPVEGASARRSVVGLGIPAGYSFNLHGTNIYMTLVPLFLAQATNTDLSIGGRILLLFVALLSSKGTTRITGAGLLTLAAALFVVPTAPAAGVTLILRVDHFMSECRVLTIFLGNAVGRLVVARSRASRMMDDWQRLSRAGPSALGR